MTVKELTEIIQQNAGNLNPEKGESIFCIGYSKGHNTCIIAGHGIDMLLALMLNALDNESIKSIITSVADAVNSCNKDGVHSSGDLLKMIKEKEKSSETDNA